MRNTKHLFFCSSYTSLNQILEIISAKAIPLSRANLVVSDRSIYRLLRNYKVQQKLKLTFLPYLNQSAVSASPLTVNYHRKRTKELFDKYFSKTKGYKVYFFSQVFWDIGFKIVKELSIWNSVNYCNFSPSTESLKSCPWQKFLLQWLFGLDGISVVRRNQACCSSVTPGFIRRNSIKNFSVVVNDGRYETLKKSLFGKSVTGHKVLVLVDADSDNRIIDKDKRDVYLTKIIALFRSYYPNSGDILLKSHPRVPVHIPKPLRYLVDENLNKFPAELLIHPQLKFIVGSISVTLMYPKPKKAKYQNISVYHFITNRPKLLEDSKLLRQENIFFPKSFLELEKHLNRELGKRRS